MMLLSPTAVPPIVFPVVVIVMPLPKFPKGNFPVTSGANEVADYLRAGRQSSQQDTAAQIATDEILIGTRICSTDDGAGGIAADKDTHAGIAGGNRAFPSVPTKVLII